MREQQSDWPTLGQLELALQRAQETDQQRRRHEEAMELVQAASGLAAQQEILFQELTNSRVQVLTSRQSLAVDVTNDELREALNTLEQGVSGKEQLYAELQSERIEKLLRAQGLANESEVVRRQLASFYAEQVLAQEASGNSSEAAAAAAQGQVYDDEQTYHRLFNGLAIVRNDKKNVRLQPLFPNMRRVLAVSQQPDLLPVGEKTVPHGRYLFTTDRVSWSVWLRRGQIYKVPIIPAFKGLPDDGILPPGSVYDEQGQVVGQVSLVALKTYEVTAREYLSFLNDVLKQAPEELRYRLVPRRADGKSAWVRRSNGLYDLRYTGSQRPVDPHTPVASISHEAAQAYIAWVSKRDGLPWRMPTELEWRYAAQSGDGRPYVWGICNLMPD